MTNGNVVGGGVIVLLAAALWLLYLVPGWVKRREYMATERNAVRLQQTIRTLAETAETPEEVFVELDARTVAAQQKILRRGQRARKAEVRAAAKEQLVAEQTERAQARLREQAEKRAQEQERQREEATRQGAAAAAKAEALAWEEAERRASAATRQARIDQGVSQAREGRAGAGLGSGLGSSRVPGAGSSGVAGAVSDSPSLAQGRRRGRLFGTCVAFVGVVLGVVGLLVGGLGLLLTVIGVILLLGGVGVLVQIARKAAATTVRSHTVAAPARTVDNDVPDYRVGEGTEPAQAGATEESAEWTPRPLPRPLHLSRGTIAQSTMASINAASELREATQRAALDERAERIVAARAAADLAAQRPAAQSTPARGVPIQGATPRTVGVRIDATESSARGGSANRGAQTQTATAQPTPGGGDQRYAVMGIIDDAASGSFNLEEAMRRRRAS